MTTAKDHRPKAQIITMAAVGSIVAALAGGAQATENRNNSLSGLALNAIHTANLTHLKPPVATSGVHAIGVPRGHNVIHPVLANISNLEKRKIGRVGGVVANITGNKEQMAGLTKDLSIATTHSSQTANAKLGQVSVANPASTSATAPSGIKTLAIVAPQNMAPQPDPTATPPRDYGDPCKKPQASERPVGCAAGTPHEFFQVTLAKDAWHGMEYVGRGIKKGVISVASAAAWFNDGNIRDFKLWGHTISTAAGAVGHGIESAAKSAGNAVESAAKSVVHFIGSLF